MTDDRPVIGAGMPEGPIPKSPLKLLKLQFSSVLLALSGMATVTGPVLEWCSEELVAARPLRDVPPHQRDVEAHRKVNDADRIIERLTELDPQRLDGEAQQRWGSLLAAARGLTMKFVGPVAHAFRTDKSAISTIMGPYGSAKTTTCFQKIINSAIWQPAGPDGVRRVRWCVIRDTYGHLQANVMADWFMWFPKTKENFNQTTNTHTVILDIPLAGGQVMRLQIEMLFRAVDNQSAEELFKGLALTGLWLNEKDTLHQDVFKFGFPRVGRYRPPGTPLGGWSGVIGDMNAPAEDNWTYDFNVNKNIGLSPEEMAAYQATFGPNFKVSFHVQPGGLDAGAENINNLPRGYYERMQIGMSEADKRRFIHNKFGAVRDGNPVYSQYLDTRHCVEALKYDPRVPVHMAVDAGNTPACVFGQKMPSGQVRVVDEVVIFKPKKDDQLEKLGGKEFGQEVGAYWNEHFAGAKLGDKNWGDPSAWFGDSPKNAEDRAWIFKFVAGFNEVAQGVRLKMKPAPVKRNLIGPRLEAVREKLKGQIDNQPAYVISDRCKVLREGYNRGYVVVRVQFSTGGGRWKDEPLKNDFSHVHDANQYLVLGLTKVEGWDDAGSSAASKRAKHRPKLNHGTGHFNFGTQAALPANDNLPGAVPVRLAA